MDLPPIMCIQCGKGPLGIKVIGPTIGFFVTVAVGVCLASGSSVALMRILADGLADCVLAGLAVLLLLRDGHRQEVSPGPTLTSLLHMLTPMSVLQRPR